jgi:TrmH family RNA methyltransferase
MLISSQSNQSVKSIRSLRQRKEREQTNLFFVEGIRLVGEAVQLGAAIETLVVAPELLSSGFAQELVTTQQQQGMRVLEVTAEVFKSLSVKEGPQGLGAVIEQRWESLANVILGAEGPELCWVALEAAQDPGNVGTILRTSDAVGSAGLILLDNTTDPYDPATLRASMGAIFSQRLVKATFAEFVAWKSQHGYTVVGASDKAEHDYQAVHYQAPLVVLMGSERQGLSPEQQAACDLMVSIPMTGRSDSLNLAVATSVLLYEVFNQRRHS